VEVGSASIEALVFGGEVRTPAGVKHVPFAAIGRPAGRQRNVTLRCWSVKHGKLEVRVATVAGTPCRGIGVLVVPAGSSSKLLFDPIRASTDRNGLARFEGFVGVPVMVVPRDARYSFSPHQVLSEPEGRVDIVADAR
jgi:hypothetical protein